MSVNKINYGFDNFSGQKTEASWLEAGGKDNNCEDMALCPVSPAIKTLTLKVQTDRNECIASDGKVILSMFWIRKQLFLVNGIRGPANMSNIAVSDCKVYLDDAVSLDSYNYFLTNGVSPEEIPFLLGLGPTNVDLILELPQGKEVYRECGQTSFAPPRGKTHTSQPAKTY